MFAEDGTPMCLSSWYVVVFSSQWHQWSLDSQRPTNCFFFCVAPMVRFNKGMVKSGGVTWFWKTKVASDITMFASLISHSLFVYTGWITISTHTHLALHFWTKLCSVCYIPPVYPSWYTHYGWSCTTIFVGPLSCRSYRCMWVCTWSLIYTWEISWDLISLFRSI
jgi:hypothetical protein